MILLDEPELHLNPRLVRGLPNFYRKHIGETFDNQIWLITHSDALLRESVGAPGFSVLHMSSPLEEASGNQAYPIRTDSEVDRAVIDIVGDLAAYKPRGPMLLVEGPDDTGFDRAMIMRLYPEIAESTNVVSATTKDRVLGLFDQLEAASNLNAVWAGEVYAVVDRDDGSVAPSHDRIGVWGRYHIENFLLDPETVFSVLSRLSASGMAFGGVEDVEAALVEAARATIPSQVAHRLRTEVNRQLVGQFELGVDPDSADLAADLRSNLETSISRLTAKAERFSLEELRHQQNEYSDRLEAALGDGSWIVEFRGRDVIKRFLASADTGTRYEAFRNLLLDEMVGAGSRPESMTETLAALLPDVVMGLD